MSFASILSEPAEERSSRRPSPPPANHYRDAERNPVAPFPRLEKKPSAERRRRTLDDEPGNDDFPSHPPANGVSELAKAPAQPRVVKARRTLSERELEVINKIVADIDNAEKSDVEAPGFEYEYERYIKKGKKRALESDIHEGQKRKVCSCCSCVVRNMANLVSAPSP